MKKIVCLSVIVMISFIGLGQGKSVKSKPVYNGLPVGSKIPDLSLGKVINNVTGKTRFSDFKGKLVILDFWNSYCSSCIEGFSHMSELQKKFGDKIQVFLVNPMETEYEINKRMVEHPRWKGKNKKDIFPSNLPIIMDAKELGKLFPLRPAIGYHVWVDGAGIVRGRGFSWNTNEEKIQELLDGKEISMIKDGGGDFDPKLPLYSVVKETIQPVLQFNSLLTRFTDQFDLFEAPIYQADSNAGIMRNTWINLPVLNLYQLATKESMKENEELISNLNGRVLLQVDDTLSYTDEKPFYTGPMTDKTVSGCRFSYEQITPLNLPDSVRKKYMLEDLNRYFGALSGAVGWVEKRSMPCWVLVRTSKLDKLQHHEAKPGEITAKIAYEKQMKFFENQEFNEILKQFFGELLRVSPNILSYNAIIINQAGYAGKVDIVFPAWKDLKSMDDLRKALQVYDLDMIKGKREVKMLVIREKSYKGNNL